ncbi:MAG TPA: SIMPL domain-containing protein [Candidatus Hydrogenedentes bacterium]|nr:SIMPL domain-containing protein [Candidatus Hydrogenedentota bacterium]HOS01469.1 SIMPL domain-containing protein [Candidatus Hydrogenedentota bacterium]
MMRASIRGLCVALTFVSGALAQQQRVQPEPITIETIGEGTVEAAPDYAEFWFHSMRTGGSVAEVLKASASFETSLREEFEKRGLTPSELVVFEPAVADAALVVVARNARVRFSCKDFTGVSDGLTKFASVCDQLRATAEKLSCGFEGPVLGLDDPKPLLQSAVAKAIEKAYPPAESAAAIMGAVISQVEKVVMQDATWNRPSGSKEHLPSLRRMTCAATVRVTYLIATTP